MAEGLVYTFPGGELREITADETTTPAEVVVPAHLTWALEYFYFMFVADGTVITRTVQILLRNAADGNRLKFFSVTATAGQTIEVQYGIAKANAHSAGVSATEDGKTLIMPEGWKIAFLESNVQAGDTWDFSGVARELIGEQKII